MVVFCLLTTVVIPGEVRPSSPLLGAVVAVSATLSDNVEGAVSGSSTVVEGEDNASESISVVTCSVVESVLDVEPAGVPSSVNRVSSVAIGGSLSSNVNALGPQMERLSVTFLSPEPVGVCVRTTATFCSVK